jgi:hypothetical protein
MADPEAKNPPEDAVGLADADGVKPPDNVDSGPGGEGESEEGETTKGRSRRLSWVEIGLGAITALIIASQAFMLWQQNDHIDRQNNLIAFQQSSNLRSLLFLPPYDTLGNAVSRYNAIPESLLYDDGHYFWPQPNEAVVEQIISFGESERDIVRRALLPLMIDNAPPVAIGALQVHAELRRRGVTSDPVNAPKGRFKGAFLRDADLRDAVLRDADLRLAFLGGADLSGADLRGVDFGDADLDGAVLIAADLRGANLSNVYLRFADVSGADLRGAILKGVRWRGTNVFCVEHAPEGFELVSESGFVYTNDSTKAHLEDRGISCPG